MTEEEALKLATHRHYKGGLYRFLGRAIHTETKEELAIYRHVWPHEPALYARPLSLFEGKLPDGRWRFRPLHESEA